MSQIVRLVYMLDVTPAYLMGWKDEIKEDIEKDLVSIANEFAEISQDHDVRSMFNDYIEFSDDRKKQVRNFITFIKNH